MALRILIWVGLFCCLMALGAQLFPEAAYRLGVDINASWRVLIFGVFLIAMGAIFSSPHRCTRR